MIRSVLLVDDEADIRTIGELSLSRIGGWTTWLAANGDEALRVAAAEQPDVILLDVMMPGADGFEVLARLRADPRTAGLRVIFLTARVQRGDLGEYLARGAIGAIAKPFDPVALCREIRRLLGDAT